MDKYNRGGMLAFLFSMAFSISFIIYLAFIQGGVDLKEVPKEAFPVNKGSTEAGK